MGKITYADKNADNKGHFVPIKKCIGRYIKLLHFFMLTLQYLKWLTARFGKLPSLGIRYTQCAGDPILHPHFWAPIGTRNQNIRERVENSDKSKENRGKINLKTLHH